MSADIDFRVDARKREANRDYVSTDNQLLNEFEKRQPLQEAFRQKNKPYPVAFCQKTNHSVI